MTATTMTMTMTMIMIMDMSIDGRRLDDGCELEWERERRGDPRGDSFVAGRGSEAAGLRMWM